MAIGRLDEGKTPKVEVINGGIAVWVADGDDSIGLVLSPLASIETGVRLISLASKQLEGGGAEMDATAVEIEIADDPTEDRAARMVFTIAGGRIAVPVNAQQLAELTAALIALSREVG